MSSCPTFDETLTEAPCLGRAAAEDMISSLLRENPPELSVLFLQTAYEDVTVMESNSRLIALAAKLKWLRQNPYPHDRPRKHWPPWFHKHDRVARNDLLCFRCGCTLDDICLLRHPVWEVLHVSDARLTAACKGRRPPTQSDQYFLCPRCSGTDSLPDEAIKFGLTPLWAVCSDKDYYQPLLGTAKGSLVNAYWFRHTSMHQATT